MDSCYQFCLKRNNFTPKVCKTLYELWQNGEQVDVTLITSCKKFCAHRLVLCASSIFFREALQSVPVCQSTVILLPNIISNDLEDLLQFTYAGEINIEEHRLDSLVNTANLLQVEGISTTERNSQSSQVHYNSLKASKQKFDNGILNQVSNQTILKETGHSKDDSIKIEIEGNNQLNKVKIEMPEVLQEQLFSETECSHDDSVLETEIEWNETYNVEAETEFSSGTISSLNSVNSPGQAQGNFGFVRRNSYTTAFKLQVVQFAELNGKQAAASNFDVDESNVRRWCRMKGKLEQMPTYRKTARGGSSFLLYLERRLEDWISNLRKEGRFVSILQATMKADQLAREMNVIDFKASSSWCSKLMSKKNFGSESDPHQEMIT